jgi:secreted trypsin-like serine protease
MKLKSTLALLLLGAALCGNTIAQQSRIVGGTQTTAGAYPHMTALIEKGTAPSSGQFCGASLVAPQWVLTAGHCMEGTPASTVEVWIGGRDLRVASEGVRVGVTQVIMHPNYGENSQGALVNDFCLLKLARAVTERTTLPLVETSAQVAAGVTSRVVGWGATSEGGSGAAILRQVDIPIVSLAIAGQTISGLGASHLAAGRVSGGIDSCQGDSGGPLMVRNAAGQWLHGGTVSFGNGCARPGEYGIYGNTLNAKSWITSYIGGSTTPVDDHANTISTTSSIALGGSTTGNMETGGDKDVFKVQASSAGTLTIQSSGSTDVVGELLNASGTVLLTNDNGAGSVNFRLTRTLTAGATFFVRVSGKTTSTTGGYAVSAALSGAPVTHGDISAVTSVDFGNATVNGTAVSRTITISNQGNAALAISGVSVSPAGDFSIVTQPAASIAAGGSTSFQMRFAPRTTGALNATVSITSNDPDENPFSISVTGTGSGGTSTGDQGNTLATAALVKVPSTTAGAIESGTDIDVFKFTLTATRTVTLRTLGDMDTYGILMRRDGSVIQEADDTSTDYNFYIRRSLGAGTYYLSVEGYSSADTGAYTLSIQ